MLGRLLIDGVDVYAQYGAYVAYGGLDNLVEFAPTKKVESINWAERDGEQFDLSDGLKLDTFDCTIKFNVSDLDGLMHLLSDGVYHDFGFASVGLIRRLRLVSQQNLAAFQGANTTNLRFADDFPLRNYTYATPVPKTNVRNCGFLLDGCNFAHYDMMPLEGAMEEILKTPSVKRNLTINTSNAHGSIYDGAVVRYEVQDVKLPCYMRSATIEGFWHNYYALLFDLIRPNERQLSVAVTGKTYSCYYKNCQSRVFKVAVGRVWWEFDLTLCFTR